MDNNVSMICQITVPRTNFKKCNIVFYMELMKMMNGAPEGYTHLMQ